MPSVKRHASNILNEYDAAQSELIGKAVALTDGQAGTVEDVWLDELHGLRISIKGHDGRWPVSASSSRKTRPAYWAEAGGFIGYGPSLDQLEDLTARFAASLLRGTIPADLPVEQPTKFELVINLKTAKAMGVTVPEALLARATQNLPLAEPL
ncbi:hypothetical protein ABIF64_001762 [Bradyrhizobium japonicum]|jgi:hypothetical protein|nr:hypothetical protein [Bradyrhizobium japonicum]MCP1792525.1 hypothetical protein [Bradyrhizobium japonicum]MCP1804960.1 hypothetical protein [Bradyrhizobium japonicum]MCP1813980.1 hypothetical protein [Bradyrhizobium japonicum]MCP1874596.1 hypothetical protein [Bradyrhizobium japonicum]